MSFGCKNGNYYSIYDPCPQDADGGLSNRRAMVGLYILGLYMDTVMEKKLKTTIVYWRV